MRHWVFDLDGTLVDSFSRYFLALEQLFARQGASFSPELRYPALTEPLAQFFEQHLGKEAVAETLAGLQSMSEEDALHIRAFEGVTEGIQRLVEQGGRVAVWTNRDLRSAELILKHSGLERYVELCVSGTCVSLRKPHPEGLSRIIDHFGCDVGSVTMIGDHEHDVMAARKTGVRAVRASWHAYWPVESCPHADHQFHDVAEFVLWTQAERL